MPRRPPATPSTPPPPSGPSAQACRSGRWAAAVMAAAAPPTSRSSRSSITRGWGQCCRRRMRACARGARRPRLSPPVAALSPTRWVALSRLSCVDARSLRASLPTSLAGALSPQAEGGAPRRRPAVPTARPPRPPSSASPDSPRPRPRSPTCARGRAPRVPAARAAPRRRSRSHAR